MVRKNEFPEIIRDLPDAVDLEVDKSAEVCAEELAQKVWIEFGIIRQATTAEKEGKNHAEVWCGINRGRGFYSRFQEWGTVYQRARPTVGPHAHQWEPIYARRMSDAVRKACRG